MDYPPPPAAANSNRPAKSLHRCCPCLAVIISGGLVKKQRGGSPLVLGCCCGGGLSRAWSLTTRALVGLHGGEELSQGGIEGNYFLSVFSYLSWRSLLDKPRELLSVSLQVFLGVLKQSADWCLLFKKGPDICPHEGLATSNESFHCFDNKITAHGQACTVAAKCRKNASNIAVRSHGHCTLRLGKFQRASVVVGSFTVKKKPPIVCKCCPRCANPSCIGRFVAVKHVVRCRPPCIASTPVTTLPAPVSCALSAGEVHATTDLCRLDPAHSVGANFDVVHLCHLSIFAHLINVVVPSCVFLAAHGRVR